MAAVCCTFYVKANPEESTGRDSSGKVVVDFQVKQWRFFRSNESMSNGIYIVQSSTSENIAWTNSGSERKMIPARTPGVMHMFDKKLMDHPREYIDPT